MYLLIISIYVNVFYGFLREEEEEEEKTNYIY